MNILYVCLLFVSSICAMNKETFESLVADYKQKQPSFGKIPGGDFINGIELMQYFPESKCATTVNGDDWYYDSEKNEWENIGNDYWSSPQKQVQQAYRKKEIFEQNCLMSSVFYYKQFHIKIKIGSEFFKSNMTQQTSFNLYDTNINSVLKSSFWENRTDSGDAESCIIKNVVINNTGVYCAFNMVREEHTLGGLTGCFVKVLELIPGTVQYKDYRKKQEGENERDNKMWELLNGRFQMGDLGRYGNNGTIIKLSRSTPEVKAIYMHYDSHHGFPLTSFLLTKDHKAKMDHLRFNNDNSVEIVVQKKTGKALLWHISPEGLKTKKEVVVWNNKGEVNSFNALRYQQPNLSIGDFEYCNNKFQLKQ